MPRIGAPPPNKRMQLTKLSAAPWHGRRARLVGRCRLMPAPPREHEGTASQLIRGVSRTSVSAGANDPSMAQVAW
jgi:hypothetical protein